MNKYIYYLIRLYKKYVLRDRFLLAHSAWVKDKGDDTLRLDYNLDENSIVFDIGGYKGEFAEKIFNKYKSTIYIFEPVKSFFHVLENKFKDNPKIKIFNFGLSDKSEKMIINLSNDGSSVYGNGNETETIYLNSIVEFLKEKKINKINLLKINIEGGEFQMLPTLLDTPYINNIENLQIQFHNFIDNAENMREKIRRQLAQTHELTYDYYFVWENWTLKK